MNVYCIYCPNGKQYVGVEGRDGRRIRSHLYEQGDQLVSRALRKYGAENVYIEYLFRDLSNEDALHVECELIRAWTLQDPARGYNISSGGQGGTGVPKTAEQRAAQSARMKGRRLSEETKRKLSEANKISAKGRVILPETRVKISNALKGKKTKPCSDATKEKLRLIHTGMKKMTPAAKEKISRNNDPRKRPVLATSADGQIFFPSITVAAASLGLDKGNVQKALKNHPWKVKGWSFEFVVYAEVA